MVSTLISALVFSKKVRMHSQNRSIVWSHNTVAKSLWKVIVAVPFAQMYGDKCEQGVTMLPVGQAGTDEQNTGDRVTSGKKISKQFNEKWIAQQLQYQKVLLHEDLRHDTSCCFILGNG